MISIFISFVIVMLVFWFLFFLVGISIPPTLFFYFLFTEFFKHGDFSVSGKHV